MKKILKALSNFQEECPLIKKDATNPFFKSKYAPLESILPIILPLLRKHGLVMTQIPNEDRLDTIIYHIETGQEIRGSVKLILAKQDPQGHGAGITYMRRYALVSMLGLNCDADDDGNMASGKKVEKKKIDMDSESPF